MKKTKSYLAPQAQVLKSAIRTSILAGSGESVGYVSNPPDAPFRARRRNPMY